MDIVAIPYRVSARLALGACSDGCLTRYVFLFLFSVANHLFHHSKIEATWISWRNLGDSISRFRRDLLREVRGNSPHTQY
jgi:hypothetical protein